MNFEDRVLVQLADPSTRAGVFDQAGLEATVRAAYDAGAMGISGPFEAVFDELRLGFAVPPAATINGNWRITGAAEQTDAQFELAGLGSEPVVRVDALWRGSIVARHALRGEPVTAVSSSWSALAGHPGEERAAMKVTFAPVAPVGETPEALPVFAAVLIREAGGFSLAQALNDSKSIRERLLAAGLGRPASNGTRPRQRIVVVWVLAETVFDDPDWPGAGEGQSPEQARAARRAAAADWLVDEGVGLVTTTVSQS